jgi:hypothetical protein
MAQCVGYTRRGAATTAAAAAAAAGLKIRRFPPSKQTSSFR